MNRAVRNLSFVAGTLLLLALLFPPTARYQRFGDIVDTVDGGRHFVFSPSVRFPALLDRNRSMVFDLFEVKLTQLLTECLIIVATWALIAAPLSKRAQRSPSPKAGD